MMPFLDHEFLRFELNEIARRNARQPRPRPAGNGWRRRRRDQR